MALILARASGVQAVGYTRRDLQFCSLHPMCGIVAAVSGGNIVPVLIEGLRKLEYRGYDSAGLAVLKPDLQRLRAVGRVAELATQAEGVASGQGIAHTRWGHARRTFRTQRPPAHIGWAGGGPQRHH
jgi:glutamine phosphoribosylpyrophosphate amidotransferase